MIIIKITYGNTTRRLAVDDILSFKTLQKFCLDMFKDLSEDQICLTYIDNEYDVVSICSDMELFEAVRQLENSDPKLLRIFIGYDQINHDNALKDAANSKLSNILADSMQDKIDEKFQEAISKDSEEEDDDDEEKDVTIMESIEEKIQSAATIVTGFVDSLELESKFRDIIDSMGQKLKQASTSLDEKILEPLSKIAKLKVHEIKEELDKLGNELKKIKLQLKADLAKATKFGICSKDQELKSTESSNSSESVVLKDLNKLEDMGFVDKKKNLELLEKHPNNLSAVINDLLN